MWTQNRTVWVETMNAVKGFLTQDIAMGNVVACEEGVAGAARHQGAAEAGAPPPSTPTGCNAGWLARVVVVEPHEWS